MAASNHYLTQYRQVLAQFAELSDEEWQLFSKGLCIEPLKKKSNFIKADEVCKKIGLLVAGSVRFYMVKDGAEITNYFCLENEWVTSYTSFLQQRPGLICIEALEDSMLVTFTYQHLQQCYASLQLSYKMERFSRLVAEYIIGCYEDRLASFIFQSPEERYVKLLESGSNILQRIPQHYIANYLGITPVSLSRIRKRIMQSA